MKQKFDVRGMSCAACVKHVEDAVKKVDGVKTCMVSLTSSSMIVDHEGSEAEIIKAVKKAGYEASLATKDKQKKQEPNTILIRIVVSAFFLLILMYVSMGHMWGWPLPRFLHDPLNNAITQLCLCLPCLALNYKYYVNGVSRLVRLKPDMDSLVSVGSGAAFVSGIVTLCVSRGAGHLYFESAAMIVTLVTVGKFFEARSKKKTNDALEKLIELTPETATVIRNGKEETVPADSLSVGDRVIVKQGERIPCDGVAVEGEGYADESAMTGESMPKEIINGERMHGGTTLISGYVVMEATGTGAETTLAQIIEMVENANMTKPRLARIADKVAGVFVPVVIGLSLATFAGWAIAGKISEGLQCAIAVLVVSCPCALGLATPVAVTVGTGKGAKRGVLFRSGEALEKLCKIKKVVFDKTGTVTEGKPKVVFVDANEGKEEMLLRVAAAAEKKSSHPLAQAVCEYAESKTDVPECDDFSAEFGKGVSAAVDGKRYFVGKAGYVEENAGVECKRGADGTTVVHVASEGEYLGCIGISDSVRSDSREGIERLKKMGVMPSLLTGDNQSVAKAVAGSVGIDEIVSDVLPDKKAEVIKEYKKSAPVAMVGDGINDAPALAVADVGIAIGGGSDIAKGNADVVLMKNSLLGVAEAVLISKDTVRNIKQNLFWAFFYNVLGIPVAAGVLYPAFGWTLNPMIASAAMSLSSLFVVSNALRYKYVHGGKTMFGKKKEAEGIVLHVEGMMCEHCKARVEQALKGIGIDGKVDLKKKTVVCPLGTDEAAAKKAITEAGYEVK